MWLLAIHLSTSAATMRAEHKITGNWLKVQGMDMLKQDIKSLKRVNSTAYCIEECENTPKCESFSYTSEFPYGTCWFKKSVQNFALNSNAVSFIKTPAKFECFANSDFYGHDVFSSKVSYDDCSILCNKERKTCNSFTWILNENEEYGQCYLKMLPDNAQRNDNSRGAVTCRSRGNYDEEIPNEHKSSRNSGHTEAPRLFSLYRPEAVAPSSRHWLKVQGIDWVTRDIETQQVSDVESCQEICEKNPICESFSFSATHDFVNATCWLKESAQNYRLKSSVDSYVKTPTMYACFANSDFYGHDFFANATAYNDCATLCNKERRRCNGFTWLLNENEYLGQCYLKTLPTDDVQVFVSSRGAISCSYSIAM